MKMILISLLLVLLSPHTAQASAGCDAPAHWTGTKIVRSSPTTFRNAETWVYGDSITYQTWRGLHVPGGTAIDAFWGRNTESAVDDLKADLARWGAPKAIVMATGTNDRMDVPAFKRQVQRALAAIPRRTRVVWVNVYVENEPVYPAAPINRIIEDSRAVVARWRRAQPAYPSPLLIDGKHVNDTGCNVRDRLIQDAL